MREMACDVLIVGGGTGGCAAAMALAVTGLNVVLTEETDWIGGQLTSQLVPPDEHPWIEQFGCTSRFRRYRDEVRAFYKANRPLSAEALANPRLNPGGGWVSRLCHEPAIGLAVLEGMLAPYDNLTVLRRTIPVASEVDVAVAQPCRDPAGNGSILPVGAETTGERVRAVTVRDLRCGDDTVVLAKYFLDATELGDLLPMTGTRYVIGAESNAGTAEPHALDGPARWDDVQGLTWCACIALDEGSDRTISKPATYNFWREYRPTFWPGNHLGFTVLHAHSGEVVQLPLFADDWYALFPYRQIVDPSIRTDSPHPATVVNWPQNDYFLGTILDVPEEVKARRLAESRDLTSCLLYWLQTEAPRHDGGVGYPGLYLCPSLSGTDDGLAKYPYIRESRRIRARHTILEQHVATDCNPDRDRAPEVADSVGIGAYRIDLHPSASGSNTIDCSTLPFQIPLGALIPDTMRNLIPACKNIGTTHITNGCYRLHPVEWNIGESAGLLAAFCVERNAEPHAVCDSIALREDFQALLRRQGIELEWPRLRPL